MKHLILAKFLGHFLQINPATAFTLHDFSKIENYKHKVSLKFEKNEVLPPAVYLQNLEDQNDVTCELHDHETEFDVATSDLHSTSCIVELPPGRYQVLDAEKLAVIDSQSESSETEFDRLKAHFRTSNINNKRKKRQISENEEWIPRVSSISPTSLSAERSGQRIEIFGEDLFPKNIDPIAGKMMEIYFLHAETGEKYPCELNAYWSSDERLICTTTPMPSSASDYKPRLRYLDSLTDSMQEAVVINRNVYDGCSQACRTYVSTNTDSTMRLFSNRFTNGEPEDSSFYTEWMNSTNTPPQHREVWDTSTKGSSPKTIARNIARIRSESS